MPPIPSVAPTTRRIAAVGVGYVLVFMLLDWASYIRPFGGLNITPWNPQPAFAIALLMWNARLLWLVWVSLVSAELAVRGVPVDLFVTAAATAALSLCYAAIARTLRRRLDATPALATRRDLLRFTAIVVGGALLSGAVYVCTFAAGGLGPSGSLPEAIARFWVGDAVGLIVVLPVLMMVADPPRRAALAAALRSRSSWLAAALIVLLLLLVFAREPRDQVRFFYLLLLPVVGAAAQQGLAGAVLAAALTQLGLIVGVRAAPNTDLTVFELQLLMAALTMTGLMLGVAVDERERAAAELRGSLRLAAAGQMAAALAHELSQPLTALGNYAQAVRLLVAAPAMDDAQRLAQLTDVSARMAEDAMRAGEVVKRLRDFFRTGSTQLQPVAPAALLDESLQAARRRAEALGVRLQREFDADLPELLMDPVQIAVVLRNLLANALDAAAAAPAPGEVRLRAGASDGWLRIEVIDNGAGVDVARLQTLFEAGPSDKPGGMGVGLSICRAIVEAHGGRLWPEPGPRGHFCLTLPIDDRPESPTPHAP